MTSASTGGSRPDVQTAIFVRADLGRPQGRPYGPSKTHLRAEPEVAAGHDGQRIAPGVRVRVGRLGEQAALYGAIAIALRRARGKVFASGPRQNAAAVAGLILLGTLFLVVTVNDVGHVYTDLKRFFGG